MQSKLTELASATTTVRDELERTHNTLTQLQLRHAVTVSEHEQLTSGNARLTAKLAQITEMEMKVHSFVFDVVCFVCCV